MSDHDSSSNNSPIIHGGQNVLHDNHGGMHSNNDSSTHTNTRSDFNNVSNSSTSSLWMLLAGFAIGCLTTYIWLGTK